MNMELYHGTENDKATSIVEKGFTMPGNRKWPGDLGRGVYTFTSEVKKYISGYEAARIYAKKYKTSPTCVLKVSLANIDESECLDLNNDKEIDLLIDAKTKIQDLVIKRADELAKDKSAKAVRRRNLDGLFMDTYLKITNKDNQINIIKKDRWEDIDDPNQKSTSGQIPNCQVILLRHPDRLDLNFEILK